MKTRVLFAMILLLVLTDSNIKAQVLQQDSLALVAFYNSTGGPNWNNNSNWLIGPVSTWYGVTVEDLMVVELIVYNNNMSGCMPPELGSLSGLTVLSLGNDNGLSGEIPIEIYQLSNLMILGLYNCNINGIISGEIGNLMNLEEITFRQTNISGPIPPEIGNLDSLIFLDLHDNQLTGPIPPELSNCSKLSKIALNDNMLSGIIPLELAQLTNLSILSLENNQLTGNIPESFSDFFMWEAESLSLDVSNNNLSGEIPESWANMNFLINIFNISYNNFTSLPAINNNWLITFIHIEGNNLAFEHIESHKQAYNSGIYWFFYYSPQSYLETEIDTALAPGSNYRIYAGTGGEFTNYRWYLDDQLIVDSPDADTLFLNNVNFSDTGIYTCLATNTLVTSLNLHRRPVHVTLDSTVNIAIRSVSKKNIEYYPNPAKHYFIAEYHLEKEYKNLNLEILDVTANKVGEINIEGKQNQTVIPTKDLKPGIYFIRLIAGGTVIDTQKMTVL